MGWRRTAAWGIGFEGAAKRAFHDRVLQQVQRGVKREHRLPPPCRRVLRSGGEVHVCVAERKVNVKVRSNGVQRSILERSKFKRHVEREVSSAALHQVEPEYAAALGNGLSLLWVIGMCARQHKVAEVACYRLERTVVRCADPPSKVVGAPHQCP